MSKLTDQHVLGKRKRRTEKRNDNEFEGNLQKFLKGLRNPEGHKIEDVTLMPDKNLVTTPPPAKSTAGIHPLTPSSILSIQSSINSTNSDSIMHSINGDGSSCSHKGSASPHENFAIYRQILQHPDVKGVLDLASLGPVLKKKVKKSVGLASEEVMVTSGLETAASIDLLKLFGASNDVLEEIGERARNGAMLLQEGLTKVNEGTGILELAFADISKHIN